MFSGKKKSVWGFGEVYDMISKVLPLPQRHIEVLHDLN